VKVCDPLDRRALVPGPHRNRKPKRPPTEFRAALQQALLPHLHETELKFDNVTRLTGINRQSLQRLRRLDPVGPADRRDCRVDRIR
jgi:hypothetical protein